MTTSAPAEVRQPPRPPDLGELVGRDDVAQAQRGGAEARADQGPHRGGRDQCEDVAHALQARARADQAAQDQGGDDHLERVADRLAEHRAHRRGVVADQEVADDDAGPQPRPVEHERGDPDPDRRPQRRDRAVQVRQPQPDLRGGVVQRREEADRDGQQHEPPRARRAPGLEVRIEPVLTGGDRAGDHGGRCEAIISDSVHRHRIWRPPAQIRRPTALDVLAVLQDLVAVGGDLVATGAAVDRVARPIARGDGVVAPVGGDLVLAARRPRSCRCRCRR